VFKIFAGKEETKSASVHEKELWCNRKVIKLKLIKNFDIDIGTIMKGYCDPIAKEVWVDYSCGTLEAIGITFHEFHHLLVGLLIYSISDPYCEERQVLKFLFAVNVSIHLTPLKITRKGCKNIVYNDY